VGGKNKFLQTDSVYLFMLIVCFSTLLLTFKYFINRSPKSIEKNYTGKKKGGDFYTKQLGND